LLGENNADGTEGLTVATCWLHARNYFCRLIFFAFRLDVSCIVIAKLSSAHVLSVSLHRYPPVRARASRWWGTTSPGPRKGSDNEARGRWREGRRTEELGYGPALKLKPLKIDTFRSADIDSLLQGPEYTVQLAIHSRYISEWMSYVAWKLVGWHASNDDKSIIFLERTNYLSKFWLQNDLTEHTTAIFYISHNDKGALRVCCLDSKLGYTHWTIKNVTFYFWL